MIGILSFFKYIDCTTHLIAQKAHKIVSELLSVVRWRSYLLALDSRLHGLNNRDFPNRNTDTSSDGAYQYDHNHCRLCLVY